MFCKSICFVSPFSYPLLVGDGSGPGGAERQFFLFGDELAKQGWRVSFITDRPSQENTRKPTSLPVFPASFAYLGGSNLHMPLDWLSLWYAMKKADADFYIIKVPGHLLAPLAIFCRIFNRKSVFWAQMAFDANPEERTVNKLAGFLQDWGIKHTGIVIAQSKEQQTGFFNNYGIDAFLVRSICKKLQPLSIRNSKPNVKYSKTDVLWAGNSMPKKRYEVVIELAMKMPEVQFVLAMNKGDDIRFKQARNEAEALPNLQFLGQVSPIEMEGWFQQTKIFLNTSTQEGFPNTFLQAWMNGVPVVSLNIDPDNVIEKNRLGYVVQKNESLKDHSDFKNLAQETVGYVETLLNDEEIRQEMGERAVLYVNKNHSPSAVVPSLIVALAPNQNDRSNENCKKNLC